MNRFDILISRETLPKARTMQEHDENSDTTTSVAGNTNESQSKVWERRIAIVVIVAASVGLLVCTGSLVATFITQKPAFALGEARLFKPGFELLGYSSLLLLIEGFLALIISSNISKILVTQQNILGYILASIGTIFLLVSFGLSLLSRKPEQEWWGYSSMVTLGTGLITITFYKLVALKRSYLGDILKLISYFLFLIGWVLSLLMIHQ